MTLYAKTPSPTVAALLALLASVVFYYARKVWKLREPMRRVIRLGMPVPKWNNVMGNLIFAGEIFAKLPDPSHSGYMVRIVSQLFPNHGAFYFDAWPMMDPMLVITDPDMAQKVVTHPNAGWVKPRILQDWCHPITGGPSVFDTNGHAYKSQLKTFSPAFSPANMMAWIPSFVDRIEIFRDLMRDRARTGERFLLEPMARNLVMDVIGEVQLSMNLNCQRSTHPLCEYMNRQLFLKFDEYKPGNILARLDPTAYYRRWKNNQRLDEEFRKQLHARFEVIKSQKSSPSSPSSPNPSIHTPYKAMIDLAIEDFLSTPSNTNATSLSPSFLTLATRNLRLFFFVGFDSTAATIQYCYYTLSRHPTALLLLRREHDSVFGPDLSSAAQQIVRSPHILNNLPYTLAVIKETMRLFPPAGGIRYCDEDIGLTDSYGNAYPTKDFSILISHYIIQKNPKFWARAEEFLPERWLVGPGHELYPPRNGWRAFENGNRMCVAQQLVMAEVKTVLVCTAREFDVADAYAEVDGETGRKVDLAGVGGERAYLVEGGAAHPNGGFPARVRFSGYVPGEGL